MEWHAEGVLLAARRHGESAAILEIFTAEQGRFVGVLRGGASRKMAAHLQAGTQLQATWRARLADHMGAFTIEPLIARAAPVMSDPVQLAGLNAVCALLSFVLPERSAYPALYAHSLALLDGLGADHWLDAYVQWELALLSELGFGLDLSHCARTGVSQDLAYVSPRTGRAVARDAAGEWADRLLPLPRFLQGVGPADHAERQAGLRLTGHFLANHLAPSLGDRPLPAARGRLVDILNRQG